jgi:hypothetical protein
MLRLALPPSQMRRSDCTGSWNDWLARAGRPDCYKLTSRRPAGRRVGLWRLLQRHRAGLLPPRLVQLLPCAGRQRGVLQP